MKRHPVRACSVHNEIACLILTITIFFKLTSVGLPLLRSLIMTYGGLILYFVSLICCPFTSVHLVEVSRPCGNNNNLGKITTKILYYKREDIIKVYYFFH